jgi:hypothetical protein
MRYFLFLTLLVCVFAWAPAAKAQDVAIGNVSAGYDSWNPSTGMIRGISFDLLNNSNDAASNFKIGAYFVNPNDFNESFLLATTDVTRISGNSVIEVTGWDVNVNNAATVPPAGQWRLAVLADVDQVLNDPNRQNNSLFISTQGNNLTWNPGTSSRSDLGAAGLGTLVAYPNPSNGSFSLRLDRLTAQPASIEVVSLTGQVVWQSTLPAQAGEISLPIEVVGAAGLHLVTVRTGQGVASVPVMLLP